MIIIHDITCGIMTPLHIYRSIKFSKKSIKWNKQYFEQMEGIVKESSHFYISIHLVELFSRLLTKSHPLPQQFQCDWVTGVGHLSIPHGNLYKNAYTFLHTHLNTYIVKLVLGDHRVTQFWCVLNQVGLLKQVSLDLYMCRTQVTKPHNMAYNHYIVYIYI